MMEQRLLRQQVLRLELVREIIAHHMVDAAKEPGAAAGHLRRASGFKAG